MVPVGTIFERDKLPDFPSKDYLQIINRLNDLQRPRANTMYIPEPAAPTSMFGFSEAVNSLSDEGRAARGLPPDYSAGVAFQNDIATRTAGNPLLGAPYKPDQNDANVNAGGWNGTLSAHGVTPLDTGYSAFQSVQIDYSDIPNNWGARDVLQTPSSFGENAGANGQGGRDLNGSSSTTAINSGGFGDALGATTNPSSGNGGSGSSGSDGLIYLDDGRVQLPSGRIVQPNVTVRAPQPNQNDGRSFTNVLGGGVYDADYGQPLNGLPRFTQYGAPVPSWMTRADGQPITYVFDSAGEPFWNVGGAVVKAI